jgi:hypothetical protein
MTLLKLYLVAYFVLLFAAAMALWTSGVLHQIPPVWIALALIIAVGLGIVLAVSSGIHVVSRTRYRHE